MSHPSAERSDDVDEMVLRDPHAAYQLLRSAGPIRQLQLFPEFDAWVVTDYEEARAALADQSLQKAPPDTAEGVAFDSPFEDELSANLLRADQPEHTRLRKLVTKAFTSRRIQEMRPRIEQIADELLDEMDGHTELDLLDAYAFPLPMTVICELLGVPDDDRDDFRAWSNRLLDTDVTDEDGSSVHEASTAMAAYLMKLIAQKREEPADDLLTALIDARDSEDRLTERELVGMVFVLLVAGHETTVNLIGNGVNGLLRNPDQLAALQANPELLPGAVEEFLRFDGPVHLATARWASEDMDLFGAQVKAGQMVLVSLLAANRDSNRFENPDRLDVTRAPGGHLAFGHGIHFCLGAALARLEGEIAFGRLLARFPDLALAGDPAAPLRWRYSTIIHGLETLPVRLTA
ncbi:cytochrome P450 [Actinoalloteichus hymeniacidonis]|nr:cytochrome P450 [Actinoalloteichus hymeniacidonis]